MSDATYPFDQQITFLYVADLGRSSQFYGETLGLPLVLDQGSCHIFQASRDGFVGVCECRQERASSTEGVIVTLVAEDVDGWHQRLVSKGVHFEKGPVHNDQFGIYHAFFRDPDGYLLEIQRFDNPGWSEADDARPISQS